MNGGTDNFWREYPADEWSDAVVAAMKLGGVEHLFFVSGSEISFYQEAIAKARAHGRPAPQLITMTHEAVALSAAAGAAMVSGGPAATAVHVDVGTLHQGGGIHTAWLGQYPILMTAGTGPRAFPGSMRGSRNHEVLWFQEPRDQGGIVRQFTKMDHRLEHQDNPGLMVSRLLQVAMSAPRGPVYLSIPLETATLPIGGVTRFPTRDELGLARGTFPDPDDAATVARWLVNARNPCVIATRLGRDEAAVLELVRLAELLALPVTETQSSASLNFPRSHALSSTGPNPKDADVVLVLESVSPWLPGSGSPSSDAKIAWAGVDPVNSRIKTSEFRADLWLGATPANVLIAVHDAATKILNRSDMTRIAERRNRLERRKHELVEQAQAQALEAGRLSHPTARWAAYQLGALLERDAILLNDGISNAGLVRGYAPRDVPGTYFRSGGSAGGWGVGAAFGAKLAAPDRDVVLATGDGYFEFCSPSAGIWAASHHKAPFLSLVFVNGSYSTGTLAVRDTYPGGYAERAGFPGGTFEPPPDYGKMAEAYGGYGEFVFDTAAVGPALKRGLAQVRAGVPAVIAVRIPSLGMSAT